jgi:hypothetical protein
VLGNFASAIAVWAGPVVIHCRSHLARLKV